MRKKTKKRKNGPTFLPGALNAIYSPIRRNGLLQSFGLLHRGQETSDHEYLALVHHPCPEVRHKMKPKSRTVLHTSSKMSQSRPGVATRTSTPRSMMRRCFCADIPPTMAATLTWGGGFFPTAAVDWVEVLGCDGSSVPVTGVFWKNSAEVKRAFR